MPASQPEAARTVTLQPGQMLSHYRLVEKIGEGGIDVLADEYVQQQYGQENTAPQEDSGFTDTWQRVRNRLLRKLLRLK